MLVVLFDSSPDAPGVLDSVGFSTAFLLRLLLVVVVFLLVVLFDSSPDAPGVLDPPRHCFAERTRTTRRAAGGSVFFRPRFFLCPDRASYVGN